MPNDRFASVGTNIQEKATMIWNVADVLRGPFKPHEYGLVILPMTVVKRFHDCLLPTHEKVLAQYEKVKHLEVNDGFLRKASGYQFYNTSIVTICMLFTLTACGGTMPAESEIKEWTRQGTFEDENGNHLLVNLSETEGYEGWGVSLMLDGETVGWIIQQEGDALRGNLNGWDENIDPFIVTITEDGEDGLKLEVEGGNTYYFTPMDVPEATIVVTVNIEGSGYIAYTEGEETPEIDPEFPAQSAYIGLAEPAVHTFLAEPEEGNLFIKWTRNGEDYSTEPQITVLLDESAEYIAVFEEDVN